MKDRGHNRDPKQCRVKLKELRQAYQKTREANGRSGSEPQTCRFYDELHAILGGSATTTPAVLFDSFNGDGGNTEASFGDEEDDDDDEVVDSSQQASRETGFPDSQELFLTLDLEPVPPEPTQGCLLDPAGGEGTSAACVSMITGSSPSQRLVKIRKKKKRTRDEMFSELMLSSHTDRAQTNAWRQIMSDCRKAQNDQEERWRAEESKWRAEESKWRAEERAEARMWRQRDERRQDSMLRLLEDQTSMLQCMVELQQRQLEHRLPLQPLCNQPPSSPSSIASTPRRPRTRNHWSWDNASEIGKEQHNHWWDMTDTTSQCHNSKTVWATTRKLNPDGQQPKHIAVVSPNQVIHQLILNGKPVHKAKRRMRQVKQKLCSLLRDSKVHNEQLNTEELTRAMKTLKCGKVAGLNGISN
ncbi:uncharacterized protein LOC141993915 [Natator depressus]|uniref:uncharacterized protein LOC141993915 n=1 Tax=Natator depressus TaxID=27790 RepID=UPI003EBE6D6F